jgi:hypothetical protein
MHANLGMPDNVLTASKALDGGGYCRRVIAACTPLFF